MLFVLHIIELPSNILFVAHKVNYNSVAYNTVAPRARAFKTYAEFWPYTLDISATKLAVSAVGTTAKIVPAKPPP